MTQDLYGLGKKESKKVNTKFNRGLTIEFNLQFMVASGSQGAK